ncbi:neurochondrin-like isoform X2 [Lytechinus variegatus]|uniref:neurochondrin-like isoform X1 n=1 Tax=Lytechinus variegatus TaxID=7654 RepID=UPI001BB24127|nr:neurochondrin-like isoform X1 [Lytechinus variegatus]XP_041464317.1 neurochondrin-like isoform X1 [Lytechinus variegatus]XP_041464324.1 neurochondrin-like isoform X1 [Lytechinus variegatus]XP_041464333.1 neurochondrin-like isoform X1 [Lytechinus variegatus]XP_041464390.1 neurochondrin-like isoform X2 [Lytechinus variegatus]
MEQQGPDVHVASSKQSEATNRAELDKCLEVLKVAKSDPEKFAALLLVTKVIKAESTDAAIRKRIFDAVGFTFLSRLLSSSSVPDGCDSQMYKSLAMTLLACFSTDPLLAASPQMVNKLPQIMECITMATSASETESTAREDAYQVLVGIASTETGRKELLKDLRVNVLCDICLKEGQGTLSTGAEVHPGTCCSLWVRATGKRQNFKQSTFGYIMLFIPTTLDIHFRHKIYNTK